MVCDRKGMMREISIYMEKGFNERFDWGASWRRFQIEAFNLFQLDPNSQRKTRVANCGQLSQSRDDHTANFVAGVFLSMLALLAAAKKEKYARLLAPARPPSLPATRRHCCGREAVSPTQ